MGTKPDYSDLADDYVKNLEEQATQEVLYRMSESLKRILENIDDRLNDLE